MTQPPLPQAFARRIQSQLGEDGPAYFEAMSQPPQRGLRLNPARNPDAPPAEWIEGLLEPIPWSADSYYLALDSAAGSAPLHEAGAYYLQEPSAMAPATVLAARPGETVLDLCAAPGGKSTQLAAAMAGQGTLVCNEPVPSRAQILSRNLERMGATNALAVCADPAQLAERWPRMFDAILVDAPCSGEGMFRRHPETRLEWREEAPVRCALRQANILQSACAMLRVGGRLCYSTCTLNREENEDTIAALLRQ
ncbi:MAG TPA: RsmB/NOP family class I SAM-dependent RNA methyltransferase, partial [Candidatus Limiplasma sp.]|nr:RsmB/NOP family class I SAM-dependent RNA methyltransferase [Candidatus Limiplasma sp.]